MCSERCNRSSAWLRAGVIDTQTTQGRDRFEDPRETAVKSDVKIKARFTPPRDPREKVKRRKRERKRACMCVCVCMRRGRTQLWDLHVLSGDENEGGARG